MITYRPVCESDIETLLGLYRSILNFEMDRKYYDYLFREWETGDYSAYVAEDDGRIVGHNGLVHFPVESDGRSVKMATSSGGMVVPEYSGIFYGILKRMLAESEVDGVIAFPNSNSQGFFLKVFEFNSIPQNYFQ
ncbi:GNAT family N-acetyltransferase, partial [bacterium]|nr:GNAT family N-acetyltransferase [bacterium]